MSAGATRLPPGGGDLSYVMQYRVPQYSSPIKEASDQKVFEVKVARHGPFA